MKLKISVVPISILALRASTIPASTAFADPATDKQIPDVVEQAISEYTTAVGDNYVGTPKTITRGEKTDADRLASKMAAEAMSADDNLTVGKADITSFNTSAVKSGQDFVVTTDISTSLSQTPNAGTKIIIRNMERRTLESSWVERHTLRLEPVGRADHAKYVVTSDTIQDEYVAATPFAGVQLPPLPQPSSTEELANSKGDVNTRPDMAPREPSLSGRSSGFNYLTAINYTDKWTSPPFYGDRREHFYPDFPYYSENCTNFISQVMYAGGLRLVGAASPYLYDTSVWTWNLRGIAGASRTWTAASYNYTFMKDHSGLFSHLDNVWRAWQGSLLYADWQGDGTIDHAMVVVGCMAKNGVLDSIIDQKQRVQHQITLHQPINNAAKQGHTHVRWYGLQLK